MNLYSSAIEFYESIHDESYQIYQRRLQNILSRKDVLAVLNPKPKALPRPPLLNFNSPTNRLAEQRKVENTLKMYALGSQTARILAQDNIKKQEDSIEQKLQNRRNSRPGSRENSAEKKSPIESFENALEKLIEKLVTDKIKKIELVNIKYQKIMSTVKSENRENPHKIMREIQQNKENELKELASRLEIERKFEIAALKNNYNKKG